MECISNPTPCEGSSSSSKHSNKSNKEKKGVRKSNKGGGGGGVRLSTDPQSVAARERRHRISDRFKILQSMVPGGSKMDTVSMLEGAIHYVKFLKTQILLHQALIDFVDVDHHESPLFLPSEYNNFPDEHSISLQQNPSSSVSVHSHHNQQSLPQLPLAQCYFQGEEDFNTFDAMPL
ncbi:hypothetical protein GLYMA_18G204700v4 [Glycine max]|uniref:BHLH domain-containing protein n=1 Tax=Glycine max TaxID=3847 RepID=I1KG08_SOYBN|nr:transcription factor bHLH140 [Glycine max]KAH1155348.1 hypothetical protein GYH30_050598 [Glycine max]KAH1199377.1 Transcription factor LAX PANICLE 1 [Glycine max]KRH00301.1 hypothetical protein GLYMA_18G204700v4 [Glycine max]|eukprot:XP_025982425.1 transcription factor bHLH140-like [Glycine max]